MPLAGLVYFLSNLQAYFEGKKYMSSNQNGYLEKKKPRKNRMDIGYTLQKKSHLEFVFSTGNVSELRVQVAV